MSDNGNNGRIIAPLTGPAVPEGAPKNFGLAKRVKAWISRRPGAPRSAGFHPSEMATLCPVLYAIAAEERENLASEDPVKVAAAVDFWKRYVTSRKADPDLQMEFDVGNVHHDVIKSYLGGIGVLWGVWRCGFCRSRIAEPGFMPRTEVPDIEGLPLLDAAPCHDCAGRNLSQLIPWMYVETGIDNAAFAKEWGFVGHMDGDLRLVIDGKPMRAALEIKSIHQAGFSGQHGEPLPKAAHITQDSLYAWCLGIPLLCFVYVCKDQARNWKEFIVPLAMQPVHEATNKIAVYRAAKAAGRLPLEHRACPDPREKRAQTCPAFARCFNGVQRHENFMAMPTRTTAP